MPPRSAAAAPVSPSSAYTGADATTATPSCFATVAPSRPSGSGSDHARTLSPSSCSPSSLERRDEDLLAEQSRVVEVARRVLAVAAVAVEERVRAGDARRRATPCHRARRARSQRRRRRRGLRSRSRYPGRARRRRPRARRAPTPSRSRRRHRAVPPCPACGEPAHSAPPERCDRPIARASTAWLGPSANGGRVVPHHSPSTMSVWSPDAASARPAASAARVRVSSSGAQTAAWPLPPRPHAPPMSDAATRHAGAAAPTARTCTAGLMTPDATCGRRRPSPGGLGSALLRRHEDADAVGEREPGRHRLGWPGARRRRSGSCAPSPCRRPGRRPSAEITSPMSAK